MKKILVLILVWLLCCGFTLAKLPGQAYHLRLTGYHVGSELLTNTTFDANTDGWTAGTGSIASVVGGYSNNCLRVTTADLGEGLYGGNAQQDVTGLSSGAVLYQATLYSKSATNSTDLYLYDSDGSPLYLYERSGSATWAEFTYFFIKTAGSTGIRFYVAVNSPTDINQTSLADSVSLKQVTKAKIPKGRHRTGMDMTH